MSDVLSQQAVSDLLDCEIETVQERASRGELPGVKFGRSWVFPAQALYERLNDLARAEAARRREPADAAGVLQQALAEPRIRGRRRSLLPKLPV